MRYFYILICISLSFHSIAQPPMVTPCEFEDPAFEQNEGFVNTLIRSHIDVSTPEVSQLVYDDFEFDEIENVDGICFVGFFDPILETEEGRYPNTTRTICDPGAFNLRYFSDNSDEPGGLIAEFEGITSYSLQFDPVGDIGPTYNISIDHPFVSFPSGKYWVSINTESAGTCALLIAIEDNVNVRRNEISTRAITPGVLVSNPPSPGFIPRGFGSGMLFSLRAAPPSAIPTMGEWGIIILGISLTIFGIVAVRRRVFSI